jgi:hypothetical protein
MVCVPPCSESAQVLSQCPVIVLLATVLTASNVDISSSGSGYSDTTVGIIVMTYPLLVSTSYSCRLPKAWVDHVSEEPEPNSGGWWISKFMVGFLMLFWFVVFEKNNPSYIPL